MESSRSFLSIAGNRLMVYVPAGILAGMAFWGIEALDRTTVLKGNFVQPGEAGKLALMGVFLAGAGPVWGLLFAVATTLARFIQTKIADARVRYPATVVALAAVFAGVGLMFPHGLNDPLYGIISGATEKVWFARLVLGHRKFSLALIFLALGVATIVVDELVDRVTRRTNPLPRSVRLGVGGVALLAFWLTYHLDATTMVTRRDLTVHVSLHLAGITAAVIGAGILGGEVMRTRIGMAAIAACVIAVALALGPAVRAFDDNQNVKSLFWRRGVAAKRYAALVQRLNDRDGDGYANVLGGFDADDSNPRVNLPLEPLPPAVETTSPEPIPDAPRPLTVTGGAVGTPAVAPVVTEPNLPRARNVIFLSIDTLRADRLGVYGYTKRNLTPNLDRFARQSQFFRRSYSTGTNTGHSFSSIFRSALGDSIFDPSIPTIMKILQEKGYQTSIVTTTKTKKWLFKGRWFEYKKIMMDNFGWIVHDTDSQDQWKAAEMTDRTIAMIDKMASNGPFFTWIHYTDPHAPYDKHAECMYGDADPERYESEIAYTDMHVGRLLTHLKEKGLMDNTIIAFTSDHGEGFGEHGEVEHGCLPYVEQNFVPLWVYTPELPGRSFDVPVSHLDIAPTLLGFVGIQPPPAYEGVDLVKYSKGLVAPPGPIVTETPRNIPEPTFFAWALTEGDWKIIYDRVGNNWQLYDLTADPLEQRNLVDLRPAEFAALKKKLGAYWARQAAKPNFSNWKRFE